MGRTGSKRVADWRVSRHGRGCLLFWDPALEHVRLHWGADPDEGLTLLDVRESVRADTFDDKVEEGILKGAGSAPCDFELEERYHGES